MCQPLVAKVAIKRQSERGEAWPASASDFTASDFSICHEASLLSSSRETRARIPGAIFEQADFLSSRSYRWFTSGPRISPPRGRMCARSIGFYRMVGTIASFLQFAARAVSGNIRPQNCVFDAVVEQTCIRVAVLQRVTFRSNRSYITEMIYVNFQSFKAITETTLNRGATRLRFESYSQIIND